MSSKTLVLAPRTDRLSGAVVESSIGSLKVAETFDLEWKAEASPRLPAGPWDRVIATLPAQAAAFRILDLPFRDRRRASQAVGPAIEEHVPFSLDEGALAWDFASAQAGSRVLAALAEPSRLAAVRSRVTELAATPQRLLWAPSVVMAAYRRAIGETASFVAVDLGEDGAVIAKVEDGTTIALRVVAPCDDELLVRNTAWSLATIADEGARVVIGGRFASRLGPRIEARTPGLRLEPLPATCPVEGFSGRDWRDDAVVVGLLLAATGDATAPLLDFEAGAGSLFGLAQLRELGGEARPLLRWAAAAAALALISVGLDYVELVSQHRALAGRAEEIYTSAMPSGSGGSGRKLKMDMRLRELSGKADAASARGAAGSPLALLTALSREVPKNLEVALEQVEHLPPAAKVSGHAASFETVTKMQEALQKSGAFARVEVKDVHAAVSGGGVEFLLELATPPAEGGA